MAHVAPTKSKINTNPTQLACDRAAQRAPGGGKKSRGGRGPARVTGDTRESVRDSARVVVEAECGILVYPPEETGEPWRAVFTENGRRRFRQAMTEAELAAKLAKVTDRLRAGAPDMERPGADLIAHSRPGTRLPGSRLARRARRRRLDLAQPAARVLHHRPVHLETRRHRRVPHGRPRQLPHHPRHVRRHHQGRPGPRPPRHPVTTPAAMRSRAGSCRLAACPVPPR
jgi:hypothetical protein